MERQAALCVVFNLSLVGLGVACDPENGDEPREYLLELATDEGRDNNDKNPSPIDEVSAPTDPQHLDPGTGDYVVQATSCQLEDPDDTGKLLLNNGAWYYASGTGAVFLNCPISFNNASTIDSKTLWYKDSTGAEFDNAFISAQLHHRTPTGSGTVQDDQWDSTASADTDYNRVTDGTNITVGDNAYFLRIHFYRTGNATVIFTAVSFDFV